MGVHKARDHRPALQVDDFIRRIHQAGGLIPGLDPGSLSSGNLSSSGLIPSLDPGLLSAADPEDLPVLGQHGARV